MAVNSKLSLAAFAQESAVATAGRVKTCNVDAPNVSLEQGWSPVFWFLSLSGQ